MDYKKIEELVKGCKDKNEEAMLSLIDEFKPIIYGYVRRFYIHGYDNEDLVSESIRILLHAVTLYDLEKHRFVSYGINAIKNNLLDLHKRTKNKHLREGFLEEHDLLSLREDVDYSERVTTKLFIDKIKDGLSPSELELLDHLIWKDLKIKDYALLKNLSYSAAIKRKGSLYKKLKPKLLN